MDEAERSRTLVAARIRAAMLAPITRPTQALWKRVPPRLKHNWITTLTVDTIRLVRANRVMGIAAEVSFWAVLSVTPLLLVSASALGWIDSIFGFRVAFNARQALTRFVRDLLGIGNQAVEAIDQLFDSPDPTRLTIGIITSVYASSRGFTSLIGGLDHITGRSQRRSWLTTRIAGFVAALLSVPALVALLILVNVGRTGFGLPSPWHGIVSTLMWPVIALGLTGFALSLLHGSPAERTPMRNDLLGAVVSVVIWLGGSWVTARYLGSAGSDVLGILGGSVGLLIWLYIMTSGVLIGAQINVARELQRAARSGTAPMDRAPDDEPSPSRPDSDDAAVDQPSVDVPVTWDPSGSDPAIQASGSTRSAS